MSTFRAACVSTFVGLAAFASGCLGGSPADMDGHLLPPTMSGPGVDGAMPTPGDGGALDGSGDAASRDGAMASTDMTDPCAVVTCGANATCGAGVCSCAAGYSMQGGMCKPNPVGDPTSHTQADVCSNYKTTGMGSANFFSTTATACDPGQLTSAGIGDAVARINFFRWLSGLAAVTDDATSDTAAQDCSVIAAWNPAGSQAHSPPPTSTCYNATGAGGAGESNIAWGCGTPVSAIDQWIHDDGNQTTLGHRRWILNPPLDPVGFGLYVGGNNYGSAACLVVFGQSGTGARPDFMAYPPPGFVPLPLLMGLQWSFTSNLFDYTSPTVTVQRTSDSAMLAVTMLPLYNPGGFNYEDATSFMPSGWAPVAGETYHVTVSDGTHTQTYDVKPVDCN